MRNPAENSAITIIYPDGEQRTLSDDYIVAYKCDNDTLTTAVCGDGRLIIAACAEIISTSIMEWSRVTGRGGNESARNAILRRVIDMIEASVSIDLNGMMHEAEDGEQNG